MAKNDQEDQFEKIMSANLARTVDFLKFAETKNAALLTFCSAWILAILGALASQKPLPEFITAGLRLSLPFFAAGAWIAITSFLPKLSIREFFRVHRQGENMLYFGDIETIPIEEFVQRTQQRYFPKDNHSITDDYVHDLSIQIAVNSRIVARKMRLFSWGARSVLLALFWLAAPAIGRII